MLRCLTADYERNQTDEQFKKKKKNKVFQIFGKSVVIKDKYLVGE